MIIDVIQGDWLDAGLNFAGTFIDATDVVKTGGIIGKFLINNADDIGLYAEIVTFLNKNFPDAVKHLGKSDEFVLATKEVVKASNGKITKKQYKEMLKSFAEAGIEYLFSENSDLEAVPTYTPYTDEMRKYIIVPEDGYQAYLERQYIRIRKLGFDDIPVISQNTGISENNLYKLKKHVFLDTHMISIEGAPLKEFYFQADSEIAYAWSRAIKGELSEEEKEWFVQLLKHELEESRIMNQEGLPLRDPSTYINGISNVDVVKNAHDKANLTAPQPIDGFPEHKTSEELMKYIDDEIWY